MKVMIVEKPSMKRKMEKALGNEVRVVSSVGHIESLSDLESYLEQHFKDKEKIYWKDVLRHLPFIPGEFRHSVTNRKVFAEIENALKNATEIILGADPDREGELIHRNILEIAKARGSVKTDNISRIWLHSETAPEIKKAFKERKNYHEYEGYYNAARSREIVDWLVGIQLTILYSVRYGKPGKPVSIGRVQTWLLAEIIRRFIENRDFVPAPYRTFSFLTSDGVSFNMIDEDEKILKLPDLEEADKLFNSLKDRNLRIDAVKKKKFTEYAPMLYDLKTLQKDAAVRYGIPPEDTLKAAQALYEKYDLISYPRTDCNVLSEQEAKELKHAMNLVYKFNEYRDLVFAVKDHNPSLELNKKYIGKLEGHYAIIPVLSYDKQTVPELQHNEKLIFDLIVKRFCAALLRPAKGETTEFKGLINQSFFLSKFKNYTDPGFLEFIKPESKKGKEDDKIISVNYTKGDQLSGTLEMKEDMTKPPALFKDHTLLSLMEKAHLQIKDTELKKALKEADGIGTAATRATFAPLLIRRGYIIKESDGTYVPTDYGLSLFKTLPEELTIPDFSAKLEHQLSNFVKKKEADTDKIVTDTETFLKTVFEKMRSQPHIYNGPKEGDPLGICPICKGKIFESPRAFNCTGECGLTIWQKISGASITREVLNELLEKEKTAKAFEMTSKAGKKFSAHLFIDKKAKRVGFDFVDSDEKPKTHKLSEKQVALIEKHGNEDIKAALKSGDNAACHQWIDEFFRKIKEKK